MGAVYLALDTRLHRKLAMKVMLPQFAADAAGNRIMRNLKSQFFYSARHRVG
jgi:hypothetical protein